MKLVKIMAGRFSYFNRKRKLSFALKYIERKGISSILVVGATPSRSKQSFVNLIEEGLAKNAGRFVVCGLESESKDWDTWIQADGLALPFPDKEFDLVFSNAVIEHVGNESDQLQFIREHSRVGKNWMITTPNRLFPIESHTQILIRHMRKNWRSPGVTRLLSKRDLQLLIPASSSIKGSPFSPTFIAHS